MHRIVLAFIASILIVTPSYVHAYIGPGLGVGVIGALIGGIMAIFLAFVGLLWYPIKRLFRKKTPEIDQKIEINGK